MCTKVKQIASPSWRSSGYLEPYFVETTSGDLVLVHRYSKTCKLLIHSKGRQLEYVPMVNLGGDSLLLGINHSISVKAANYTGCLPNSIYCADNTDCLDNNWIKNLRVVQVFNLNDQSVKTSYMPIRVFRSMSCNLDGNGTRAIGDCKSLL